MLLLLDHAGQDEALREAGDLRFFTFKTGMPKVRLDGAEVAVESVTGSPEGPSLWRAAVPWKPGRNMISVEASGSDGKPLARDYSFVNLAGGSLPYRQKVLLAYGEPGSRSGPFYRLEAEGDAVALGAELQQTVDSVDDDGWLTSRQFLVREIVGASPGEAVLRIFETPHFRQPETLLGEIRLQVPAKGGNP